MAQAVETIGFSTAPERVHFLAAVARWSKRNPTGATSGVFCVGLVVLAVIGPYIAPYPADLTTLPRLHAPSWDYPFGTDNLFRDMFSRILVGARNSIGIAFGSVAIATLLGLLLGLTSGYVGGWWDMVVGRLVDASLAFPNLVFLVFFLTIFEPSYISVSIALGLNMLPAVVRVVRGATIGVRHQPYIEAAMIVGASRQRIIVRHVLPNVTAPIIVIASIQIGYAILVEAALSFLGLSVSSAQNPSWGRMLQETRQYWQTAWWTAIVPGAAISTAVLMFNLFGDALRDALDPRLRGSR
jgi:peptide/nickel transport system permease protein